MIVTFYSSRIAVGQTRLLVDVANYLCHQKQKRVLLIDWCVPPELHYRFNKDDKDITNKGLIDLCKRFIAQAQEASEENPLKESDLFFPNADYLTSLAQTDKGGTIDLLPATRYNEAVFMGDIFTFDWLDFYDNKAGNVYLVCLRQYLRSNYDYVLIDSGAGSNSPHWGICHVLMPDINLFVVSPNEQSFQSSLRAARRISNAEYTKTHKSKVSILPILSGVEEFHKQTNEQRERFVHLFEDFIHDYSSDAMEFVRRTEQLQDFRTFISRTNIYQTACIADIILNGEMAQSQSLH
jgi:hypothetical protein